MFDRHSWMGDAFINASWAWRITMACSAAVLAACSSAGSKIDVPECAQPQSPECAAALDRIQVLNYDVTTPDRLVAASSRAIGDLNFELIQRDDSAGRVMGRYVGSAPTHPDLLDSRFHKALGDAASVPLVARIDVGTARVSGGPVPVRVQLLLPGSAKNDPAKSTPLAQLAPYQILFEQLSLELAGRVAPPPGENQQDEHHKRPQKPGVLPGSASVPTGL